MKKNIPYSHQSIDQDDINALIKTLKSDFITQGPKVLEFEKGLAQYTGAKYAVVFNSGTSALHAAYWTLGIKKEAQIITSPITFAATANAGLYVGAKPIFVDIERDTGNINSNKIEAKITKKSKLIVPVHFGGHPVDLEKIHKIAQKNNLYIIEDAAHALGAKYKDEKIGNCKYSQICVFSFHPVKHITTGEGGAVTTNNPKYYEKLLMFRTHGITKEYLKKSSPGDWYYEMQYLGFNYRMPDILAALGISQLKKLDRFVQKRREIAQTYKEIFKNSPFFEIPNEKEYAYNAYHLFPVKLKDKFVAKKREIFSQLRKNEVGVQVHYIPVYFHPYYEKLGYKKGLCPISEDFYERELSIPIYPSMSKVDIEFVIVTINKIFRKFS